MKLTILLDLDDTLLSSNMDKFIPAYFQALSKSLEDLIDPDLMLTSLMAGTKKMMEKSLAIGSLSDEFDQTFYKMIGIEKEALATRLDNFYDDIFPTLGYLTSKIPEAIEFVERSFNNNYQIIIATNPIFPIKAVEHRLRWAGLDPDEFSFSLITSYEDFHFTKENIAYFPEILGRLGWPDDPAIMIGNDLEMDIKPAIQAGFPVFWVEDFVNQEISYPGVPKGTMKDIYPWLESQHMEELRFSPRQKLAVINALKSTPAVFDGWLNTRGKNSHAGSRFTSSNLMTKSISRLLNNERETKQFLLDSVAIIKNTEFELKSPVSDYSFQKENSNLSVLEEFTIERQGLVNIAEELFSDGSTFPQSRKQGITEVLEQQFSNDIFEIRQIYREINHS